LTIWLSLVAVALVVTLASMSMVVAVVLVALDVLLQQAVVVLHLKAH
jgi:hypothetical protein